MGSVDENLTIGESILLFFQQLGSVLRSFNWTSDLLDVLFVSLLIYGLIRLIRQTRGAQLLKGLALLLMAYGVVWLLNMRTSLFLFGQAFSNVLLVIVVLFQPEIRNVFESVGRSKVSRLRLMQQTNRAALEREDMSTAIHHVCEAFRQLSADHTGALVVFERVTQLGDIARTGTVLEARVSKELIGNIFTNKAPLHDGAVIIRKGRLEAAGCVLPLTQKKELDSALGTRHRAAIGISEQSDAAVAVVSEETGSLSLAFKGKLRRAIGLEELEQALNEALMTQEPHTAWYQRLIRRGRDGEDQ
ncbi:MAG: diadenylate cyclase CdaA [Oscillospiraceae bacterium]|jgi:diadenylate cyclase|nr:diadenylate cyclase CdaA [Oscillospiraceae bacterium]